MTIEDEPVFSDDAIARAMRAALVRTVAATPAGPMSWNRVLSRARRVVIVRRVVAVSLCVVLALAAGAVAFASTSTGGRRGVAAIGSEPATVTTTPASVETTTSSTLPPTTTSLPVVRLPVRSGVCDSCAEVSPSAPLPQPARPGDFTGTLQHWREICDPCLSTGFDKGITVKIRNITDHPIDLSTAAPVRVAVVCATNMTADGRLTKPLPAFPANIFVDESPAAIVGPPPYDTPGVTLAPGAQVTDDGTWGYGVDGGIDPGPATCEAALVVTSDGTWRPQTLSVVSRLANVPAYSFEVIAPPLTTTTTTTTTSPPTSTLPPAPTTTSTP